MRRLGYMTLAFFVFSLPWQNAISISGTRSLTSFIGFALIAVAAMTVYQERRIATPPAVIWPLLAFAAWELASIWWSIDYSTSFYRGRTLFQLVAMVWVIGELTDSPKRYFGLMQAYVLGAVVVAALLIQAWATGQPLEGYRYAPEDFSLNGSAIMLAVGIALALILIRERHRVGFAWLNIAYVPIATFSVILTASRSGFFATAVALAGTLFVIGERRTAHRVAWSVAIVGAFTILFFTISGNPELSKNLERVTFATDTHSLQTLTGRTTIWSAGWSAFQERPLIGSGGGTFGVVVQDYFGHWRAPHNLFISVAVEAGAIGVLVILSALASALVPALRTKGALRPLFVVLFLVVFEMAFIANVDTNKVMWFTLTVLSMSAAVTRTMGGANRIGLNPAPAGPHPPASAIRSTPFGPPAGRPGPGRA